MACVLSAPRWVDSNATGVISAIENIADNTLVLSWNEAQEVSPATEVYYIIYSASTEAALYNQPKFISTAQSAAIPLTLVSVDDYFAVKAAQFGVADLITNSNLVEAFDNGYFYPAPTELAATLAPADGYIYVDSISSFPSEFGYLRIGSEIISFSLALSSHLGSPAFIVDSRDPYGCNDGYLGTYPIGTPVSLYVGSESGYGSRVKGLASCGLDKPTWVDYLNPGIKTVKDLGIGGSVQINWDFAKAPAGFNNLYYNVYYSTLVDNFNNPYGITAQRSAVVPNLHPGDGYFFSVRASYLFDPLATSDMEQVSSDFFAYPAPTTVNELDGYYHASENGNVRVASTDGFPANGLLRINSEVLQYSSKTSTTFIISRRDVFDFGVDEDYANGTEVFLFKGIEDGNTSLYMATPSWTARSAWLPVTPGDGYDGYLYLQDSDGYRSFPVNNITEVNDEFESNNEGFEEDPKCGFRATNLVDLYSRNQCGTYIGGRIGGFGGGIDMYEVNMQRQEMLLGLTGDPFILLRKKWTGKTCPRLSIRTEHPHSRCSNCYGTTFAGGFDRYMSSRELRPNEPNPNGFISCRVEPYTDDLGIFENRGLSNEVVEMSVWTTAIPHIKDRDILIHYEQDIEFGVLREAFRYEVLSVSRNKLLLGKDGKQTIRLKRLNKTEEIYRFPINLV